VNSGPLKFSFDAVTDGNTRVVILGSLPGEISLLRRQYYANPTNQFWRLVGAVITCDLVNQSYERRLQSLLDAGIGLWDVVKEARRKGSGDSAIKEAVHHPLQQLVDALPKLQALAFNGGKSESIGKRQLVSANSLALIPLPSSSAAYCSIAFEAKLKAWMAIRNYMPGYGISH
jgi:hypoxanthine-DNA glycosylase